MTFRILLLIIGITTNISYAQDRAFQLFDKNGELIQFSSIINAASEHDVILFGEFHDQPIAHWLQLELLKALHQVKGDSLLFGAEMFETDNQIIIEEYVDGLITEKKFESEVRLWNNYKTDYKPLLNYCLSNNITFTGTNAPGRYVNALYNQGMSVFENMSAQALQYLCPLPLEIDYDLPGYAQLLSMGSAHGQEKKYFVEAQALRDATMAHAINKSFIPGYAYLHINGSYHSNNYEGIAHYLSNYNPNLKILVITTVYQSEIEKLELEHHSKADFIICIPENMSRSY